MLINRENYEDFFLLYADDELCISERKEVEEFIAANSDLKPEFDMLLATVLPKDEIVFSLKEGLYKNEIPDAAMQEKLLLFLDDELPENERAPLEILLKTDEVLQTEHSLLLQTKLTGEKTVFPDKHLLYRTEKAAPIMLPFLRWAAAAAILGMGLFAGFSLLDKKNTDIAINQKTPAPETTAKIQEVKKSTGLINKPAEEKTAVAFAQNKTVIIREVHERLPQLTVKTNSAKIKEIPVSPKDANELGLVRTEKKREPEKKITPAEVINLKPIDNTQSIASVNISPVKTIPEKENRITEKESAFPGAQSLVSNESQNKIFYLDEDEVRRSKPFGIIKKVKRFVERTANLKPGNTLRIAGFEFKGS